MVLWGCRFASAFQGGGETEIRRSNHLRAHSKAKRYKLSQLHNATTAWGTGTGAAPVRTIAAMMSSEASFVMTGSLRSADLEGLRTPASHKRRSHEITAAHDIRLERVRSGA
jgi:hypothetical protein